MGIPSENIHGTTTQMNKDTKQGSQFLRSPNYGLKLGMAGFTFRDNLKNTSTFEDRNRNLSEFDPK